MIDSQRSGPVSCATNCKLCDVSSDEAPWLKRGLGLRCKLCYDCLRRQAYQTGKTETEVYKEIMASQEKRDEWKRARIEDRSKQSQQEREEEAASSAAGDPSSFTTLDRASMSCTSRPRDLWPDEAFESVWGFVPPEDVPRFSAMTPDGRKKGGCPMLGVSLTVHPLSVTPTKQPPA